MEGPIKHLYVIGNGFDIYHGAQCTYNDFYMYLKKHATRVAATFDLFFGDKSLQRSFVNPYDYIVCESFMRDASISLKYYPQPTWSVSNLWKDFETHLSSLNREKILELLDEDLPDVDEGDPDFLYANYQWPLSMIVDALTAVTAGLKYHLHRWINTISYKKGHRKKLLRLDADAVFLSFNYTTFLEDVYGISRENIRYIHGCRKDKIGSLIIGHNQIDEVNSLMEWKRKCNNKWKYRPNIKSRNGRYYANDRLPYLAYFLKDDSKGNWKRAIRYYAVHDIIGYIEEYYKNNYKDTNKIIEENAGFFNLLGDVERITVLWHSLSNIDLPYFREIVNINKAPNAITWKFYYHTSEDDERIDEFCKIMNVSSREKVPSSKLSEMS